jgi:glycosyltransferase involved in cell wall biosynthesis
MKISIITVCLNSEKTILNTLRSVQNQNYKNIEYIIIDGGSKDRTLDILAAEKHCITKLISEADEGIYEAMNKGLSFATGDVVGFLNSDDFFTNSNIISLIANCLKNSSVDACYGDLIYISPGNTTKVVRYWKSQKYNPGLFDRGWMPPHPTFYARRSLYSTYGNFDLKFKIAADFDLLFRFFRVYKITSLYIPQTLVTMTLGGVSNRSFFNIYRQNVENIKIFHKYGFKVGLNFFIFKLFHRLKQFLS